MSDVDKAVQTQLANIQVATGKTLDELYQLVRQRGVAKHGEILKRLKRLKAELGLGHGDANAIALQYLKSPTAQGAGGGGQQASGGDILDEIYSGAKAPLRPIHEAVMTEIRKLGERNPEPLAVPQRQGPDALRTVGIQRVDPVTTHHPGHREVGRRLARVVKVMGIGAG